MKQHVWSTLVDPTRGRNCQMCGDWERFPHNTYCPDRILPPADVPSNPKPPLCPDTIRACIEAVMSNFDDMPDNAQFLVNTGLIEARTALEALLPQPDHAKELVERYYRENRWGDPCENSSVAIFTRWLLSNNIIDTSKLGGE